MGFSTRKFRDRRGTLFEQWATLKHENSCFNCEKFAVQTSKVVDIGAYYSVHIKVSYELKFETLLDSKIQMKIIIKSENSFKFKN